MTDKTKTLSLSLNTKIKGRTMDERRSNYDIAKENARKIFLAYDQRKLIERWRLDSDKDFIYLFFVGDRYSINRQNGQVLPADGGSEVSFNTALSIYDLLTYSKPDARLYGSMGDIRHLSRSNTGWLSDKHAFHSEESEFFDTHQQELEDALEKMGAIKTTGADEAYLIPVFDRISMIFQFWRSDEDFPSEIKFFWDLNITDFMHFETVWYASGHILKKIIDNMPSSV